MKVAYGFYNPGFNPYQRLFAGALEAAGVDVVRVPPRKLLPLRQLGFRSADVIHLDWPHDLYNGRNALSTGLKRLMYADGIRLLRKRPLVWTAHNLVAHDSADPKFERQMMQRLVDVCNGIVVMSHSAEKELRSAFCVPHSCVVRLIHHGHYIDAYPNTTTREEARERLGLLASARVVLSLGRIARYKGLDKLIRAFSSVAQPGDVLVIAGCPQDQDLVVELRDLATSLCPSQAAIRLEPVLIPDDELQAYFGACDLVAIPFERVLNSGSLLLAMSFGRCVVAPAIGSLHEIACPEAFYGYAEGDVGGLGGALRNALARTDLLERGAQARKFTQEAYSWSDIGFRARDLYSELLSSKPEEARVGRA